jgi:hypothetical protein
MFAAPLTRAPSKHAGFPPVQAKLIVGSADDACEHEADRVAARVVNEPFVTGTISAADGASLRRACCAGCEAEEKPPLRRKSVGTVAPAIAPAQVDAALSESGQPLGSTDRAFFEPRFGFDFSRVRIHTSDTAAASAAAVGARGYTVGEHIVFGAGNYVPGTPAGRLLLAHELTHVVQQGRSGAALRRAPCRTAAECKRPNPGDPGRFGERASAQEAANAATLKAAPPGSSGATLRARNGQPAVHVANLVTKNGAPKPPEVFGFFINPAIGKSAGAENDKCRNFPAPGPAGAPPEKNCVQIPAEVEDGAAALDTAAGPASPAQQEEVLEIVSIVVHEMQHARFDDTQSASIASAADCKLDTVVFHGPTAGDFTVEFYLSELSAITSEFAVYFQNFVKNKGRAAAQFLEREEQGQAFDKDESLLGVIRGMQCACSCGTVDSFVTQTVTLTTSGWPPDQTLAFLRTMTLRIPNVWPRALHRK